MVMRIQKVDLKDNLFFLTRSIILNSLISNKVLIEILTMALNMIWDVIILKSRGIHWLVGVRFRCKLTLTTDVLVSVIDASSN